MILRLYQEEHRQGDIRQKNLARKAGKTASDIEKSKVSTSKSKDNEQQDKD